MDKATQDYIDAHLTETLDDLKRLTAQPSVSAQRWGVRECGEMVVDELRKAGFEAELVPTADPPAHDLAVPGVPSRLREVGDRRDGGAGSGAAGADDPQVG